METDLSAIIYGLEFQARALCAQAAETETARFFVGTQSLRADNQVHQIDYDEESNSISKSVYLHKEGEIWSLSSSTFSHELIATVYNKVAIGKARHQAAVWKLPASGGPQTPIEEPSLHFPELIKIVTLGAAGDSDEFGDMKGVLWHPSGSEKQVVSISEQHLIVWDLDTGAQTAQMISKVALETKGQPRFTTARWNPHHNCSQVASANDTSVRGWDLRTMQQTFLVDNAHNFLVRDIDFNPNKQYYMATCGDDCKTKFWDTRKTTEPVRVLNDHSHWVWSVRYNHFHDQLVLTSSSDSRVVLNNLTSISSEPLGRVLVDGSDDEGDKEDTDRAVKQPLPDGVVSVCEEHEDSVYAVEWSPADPWLFASLSYDGRLVVNHVPRATKYHILL